MDLIIESAQVEIRAGQDTLVIQSDAAVKEGDNLQVAGIEVRVVKATPLANYGRFNWKVDFESEDSYELRERLRYVVANT